jgi:transcription elongation factor Elf1
MLQHHHINCHLKDENIVTVNPFLSPAIGGMKLMVHHVHVERAWDLLDEAEHSYLKSIPCPVCHHNKLESVSVTKKHNSRLAALASMLLNGQSVEVKKVFRCNGCGYDFEHLPQRGSDDI